MKIETKRHYLSYYDANRFACHLIFDEILLVPFIDWTYWSIPLN